MISKSFKSAFKALSFQSRFGLSTGGGGHVVKSEKPKRIKVADRIIWINVLQADGVPVRLAGFEGQKLLDLIQQYHIIGMPGDCRGGHDENPSWDIPIDFYSEGPTCLECQVIIPDPWFDKIYQSPLEKEIITNADSPTTPNSRLACTIQLRPFMNEMIVVMGQNESQSGDQAWK